MKSKYFVIGVVVACLVAGVLIWQFLFGAAGNFSDAAREKPINLLGTVYTGGWVVPVLVGLTLMVVTFIVERLMSLSRAQGRGNLSAFLHKVHDNLEHDNVDAALDECNRQRGSAANILRAGLERWQQVRNDASLDKEKKLTEVKRAIDEATGLETPLLEKNLVALSTVASISTMFGLLGTTIGMIRAFAALGGGEGAVSATQLSIGISEALINTAFGLIAAILAIVAYNIFTNKVDNFVYMIEESTLSMMEILTVKVK
ncbi:MAG: MotA/TolQ/ExbB proton channel family protein [Chlorobi bacterium]|jgi:biopolymer transport protein ExbB|nr:MotA/TolQ/ExbB proton channel family protein [Chlorobiota bacterium]